MRRSKTHFEQISVEEVKKIVEEREEVSKQKQSGTEDTTDVTDVRAQEDGASTGFGSSC